MPTEEFWTMPGWRALETALGEAYRDAELLVVRSGREEMPLPAIFVLDAGRGHWLYVSFGLTELGAKESPVKEMSGFGFELTARVSKREAEPPTWPLDLMQQLAAYLFQTGHYFDVNHHVPMGRPIAPGSILTALAFVEDAELPRLETPNGAVQFLQLVGLSEAEEALMTEWSASRLLAELRDRNPLFVTDPARACALVTEGVGARLRGLAASEGSSVEIVHADVLEWTVREGAIVVVYGPKEVARANLPRLLRGRTKLGRPITIRSGDRSMRIERAARGAWSVEGDALVVSLSDDLVADLERSASAGGDWTPSTLAGFTLRMVE